MNTLKKVFTGALTLGLLAGCSSTPATNDATTPATTGETTATADTASTGSGCSIESMDLDMINEYLNTSADLGEGTIGNAVAIIPIDHVNGPREESKFYAFVNFKYEARNYIKYQVTYLSCTCRSADVNYWMTAYVELSLPDSGDINDSQIRFLSFDRDSQDKYTAGFWGDSNPTPAGATYEDFKEQYIPFFVDKDYRYIQTLSVMEDIDPADYSAGEGRDGYTIDTFSGSSVSANNIIRMLNALFEYHATDDYFTGE